MRYIEQARDRHYLSAPEDRPMQLQDWLRDHEHKIRRRALRSGRQGQLRVHRSGETLDAIVDHNHWIVRCTACSNAPAVWWLPDGTGVAACYQCGAIHEVSPVEDRDEIEAELVKRPPKARQYDPGETPADIRAQNRALKVGE